MSDDFLIPPPSDFLAPPPEFDAPVLMNGSDSSSEEDVENEFHRQNTRQQSITPPPPIVPPRSALHDMCDSRPLTHTRNEPLSPPVSFITPPVGVPTQFADDLVPPPDFIHDEPRTTITTAPPPPQQQSHQQSTSFIPPPLLPDHDPALNSLPFIPPPVVLVAATPTEFDDSFSTTSFIPPPVLPETDSIVSTTLNSKSNDDNSVFIPPQVTATALTLDPPQRSVVQDSNIVPPPPVVPVTEPNVVHPPPPLDETKPPNNNHDVDDAEAIVVETEPQHHLHNNHDVEDATEEEMLSQQNTTTSTPNTTTTTTATTPTATTTTVSNASDLDTTTSHPTISDAAAVDDDDDYDNNNNDDGGDGEDGRDENKNEEDEDEDSSDAEELMDSGIFEHEREHTNVNERDDEHAHDHTHEHTHTPTIKIRDSTPPPLPKGFEMTLVGGNVWVHPEELSDFELIASGALASVCSALDSRIDDRVAIKKLMGWQNSSAEAHRVYSEIQILRLLNHDNVIGLIDVFKGTEYVDETQRDGSPLKQSVYIVTDLMATNLDELLSSEELSSKLVQVISFQIARALAYVHSMSIIHSDLKPANILVNEDGEIKLADFGSAVGADTSEQTTTTTPNGFAMSLWYRAPEVIVGDEASFQCTNAVDVWAFGCILYELYSGRTLFNGSDDLSQLVSIMTTIGVSKDYVESLPPSLGLGEKLQDLLGNIPYTPEYTMEDLIPEASADAIDLIQKILVLEPHKRITMADALKHRLFKEFEDDLDEEITKLSPDQMLCSIEEENSLGVEYWVKKVFESIDDFAGDMDLLVGLDNHDGNDDNNNDADDDNNNDDDDDDGADDDTEC